MRRLSNTSVLLPIPDRRWVPNAPPEGWCGETSIQMAVLYRGAWLSQEYIHAAISPSTPDLWIEDIAPTLGALGLDFQHLGKRIAGTAFLGQIASQLQQGRPVIFGSKIYPAQHPAWNCDHIMLMIGYQSGPPPQFTFNTNLADQRQTYSSQQLLTVHTGYSLINRQHTFFGFGVEDWQDPGDYPVTVAGPLRADPMPLLVTASALIAGSQYLLRQDDLQGHAQDTPFTAVGESQQWSVSVPYITPARFRVFAL